MQKEVLVNQSGSEAIWRFLCDEGPYLDGTDLAPPPLAFFAAGMAAHNAGLLVDEAEDSGIALGEWSIEQGTFYTMEGSALRGTMTGGALPARLVLRSSRLKADDCQRLATAALKRSVAEALMASEFSGGFSISHNGAAIGTQRVAPAQDAAPELGSLASAVGVMAEDGDFEEVIRKVESVEASEDPTHGKGASLRESQKRTLHLHTELRPGSSGLFEITVHLLRPLGSTFRFLASAGQESNGQPDAPAGLDYLSAGIALCFLTQMGRYAQITRGDLQSYGVVQDLFFEADPPAIRRLTTHALIESNEDAATARRYVDMSEQTCFLHASCRSGNPTNIETEGNHEGISD